MLFTDWQNQAQLLPIKYEISDASKGDITQIQTYNFGLEHP